MIDNGSFHAGEGKHLLYDIGYWLFVIIESGYFRWPFDRGEGRE